MKRCPVCNAEYATETICPRDGVRLAEAATAAPNLVVQHPTGATSTVSLRSGAISIGTAPGNELVLDDPFVSTNHALIRRYGGRYLLSDAGSRNGVFVNGQRVGVVERDLRPGDVIIVGQTRLTFAVDGPIAPPPPPSMPVAGHILVVLPSGETRRIPLDRPKLSVGKRPDNTIILVDTEVSGRHATIYVEDGTWYVRDDASRNGVVVNKRRITEPQALATGDIVQVGQTQMSVDLVADGAKRSGVRPRPERPTPATPQPPPPPSVAGSGRSSGARTIVLDGRYELEAKITQGAAATMYRAKRVGTDELVAVKVLRPELTRDEAAVERFRRRAQVAARIRHPNSLQVFDSGRTSDGVVYVVEELLSGRTLRTLILEQRGLPMPRVVDLIGQICGAVHAAHVNGIVLRDLKPETIFVERDPNGKDLVKVGGYGLAKVFGVAGHRTVNEETRAHGTPEYMSPEQWRDEPLDSRSDVYSLGVILFELLTGSVPFEGLTPQQVARQHLTAPIPDLTDYGRPEINDGIVSVVNRALEKAPIRRQPTALLFAEELRAVTRASGVLIGALMGRGTGLLPHAPAVVLAPAPVPEGEAALPSVVASDHEHGRTFTLPVVTVLAETLLSRVSSGLIKTAVPLFALLVFGLRIHLVVILILIQNLVPQLLTPVFGALADRFGTKKVFLGALAIRTICSLGYIFAGSVWSLVAIGAVRGASESAKEPSASAIIADSTSGHHRAHAFAWYTMAKSVSTGLGESLGAFLLIAMIAIVAGQFSVSARVAVLDEMNFAGKNHEVILSDDEIVGPDGLIHHVATGAEEAERARSGTEEAGEGMEHAKVLSTEIRRIPIERLALEDYPKTIELGPLRAAIASIFVTATVLSALALILVAFVVRETNREDRHARLKHRRALGIHSPTTHLQSSERKPSVLLYALLGGMLTAPVFMASGEFFTILAVELDVTPGALGLIKIVAEVMTPLVFGPVFGWLAVRAGAGLVIGLRAIANVLTSLLFWITPWFYGSILLALVMGLARAMDEIGMSAFKPTWGAVSARIASYHIENRTRAMGAIESGIDGAELIFPVVGGLLLEYVSLGPLMLVRAVIAIVAEVYGRILMKRHHMLE